MGKRELADEDRYIVEQVLGYLNFSTGAPDPRFLSGLDRLHQHAAENASSRVPPWQQVSCLLKEGLGQLQAESQAFDDSSQAAGVLELLYEEFLPAYLQFHRDLLFHQSDLMLFNAFFVGRAAESILQQGPPWEEGERIVAGALSQLNDYIGYRPVATLESQKIEPYAHEWVRPVPLFVRDAGVCAGPYREVVERAIRMLETIDEDLLRAAHFDPQLLDELAFDPRAYDFDHPVNKRPNYHFGQWDPHHMDHQGRYRRFVVQQVTLDALLRRLDQPDDLPAEELWSEAATVLAGTILMASGICGSGPDAHDSTVTLGTLVPQIAQYRDEFYERLLDRTEGPHGERLREEQMVLRQPFGGARQSFNAELARRRASQLEHVHLARIFARMGYPEAAKRQADVVPVASARMLCRIDNRITAGHQAVAAGDLKQAATLPSEIMDILIRAIQCGAVIDPWNILGFDANFSLFPAMENSDHDHRAEELVELMERIFALYSRIWSEAAAVNQLDIRRRMDHEFSETAGWWRQFATHEVSSVKSVDALELYQAAKHVVEALSLWHQGGAATGDVRFWAPHAAMFDSPRAYALVVEALLERHDFVASMSLLVHWLSQADRVSLEHGDSSFDHLAERWLFHLLRSETEDNGDEVWTRVRKFFDYIEANADQYWQVPSFELHRESREPLDQNSLSDPGGNEEAEEEDGLFDAAYEDVVYHDSTDDGMEGSIFESDESQLDDLTREANQVTERLAFLACLARMWKLAAVSMGYQAASDPTANQESLAARRATMQRWIGRAVANGGQLRHLIDSVQQYRLPSPSAHHASMLDYDRQRLVKETLLERIIGTTVEMAHAVRLLSAAVAAMGKEAEIQLPAETEVLDDDQRQVVAVFAALLRRDLDAVRQHWPALCSALKDMPLLYVPLSKGGDPRAIVATRVRQNSILDLLASLPRVGLLVEATQLIDLARTMERAHPVGPGAVTEFDELFEIGYQALVESLVRSASVWQSAERPAPGMQVSISISEPQVEEIEREFDAKEQLVSCLEQLTESLLASWLAHSRTLRLTVLEKVDEEDAWNRLVAFIQRYGGDIFTQKFLNLGKIRAILHQGVESWLHSLQQQQHEEDVASTLVDDLDEVISKEDAVSHLTLVLEALIENYNEYRDYNSTTTQSDRGELLYTLFDFLRLRGRYDRVSWNLRPVVWAHEILVRNRQTEAARMWRRALAERIGVEADAYLERLNELQKKYAMRMPTIADRLNERFIKPMTIDRMRALVKPAMEEAGTQGRRGNFEMLEHVTELLTREPSGVGFDLPPWLEALEDEVEQALREDVHCELDEVVGAMIEPAQLPLPDVQQQLDRIKTLMTPKRSKRR